MEPLQIDWTLDSANPVIKPGQIHPGLDDNHAGACHVLDLGDKYRIYYWGHCNGDYLILMAESSVDSPNDWHPVGGALLEPQPETKHNCGGPSFPYVVPVTEARWHMYFGAWGTYDESGKLPNCMCLAVSEDAGLTWEYHSRAPNIASDKPWDSEGTGSVSVMVRDGKFHMYYTSIAEYFDAPEGVQTGHGARIPRIGVAYAVSDDGINWEKPLDNLMVAPRGFDMEPYEYINSKPFIIRDGDGYRMWISTFGYAYRIRSLVSDDGIEWTRVPSGPDGDIGIGEKGAFDDIQRSYASVVKHGDEYRMWFTGNGFGATGMGYATGRLAK